MEDLHSRRTYDYRIQEAICETGDRDLFPELEIPRSTIRSWIHRGATEVVSCDFAEDDRVVCQNSADRLSGPPFVVVEHPTQPFMADDGGTHVDDALPLLDQPVVESLMISLEVVMLRVFLHGVA